MSVCLFILVRLVRLVRLVVMENEKWNLALIEFCFLNISAIAV